jgi:carbamate kinase
MRIVIALGGNALLRRGEPMTTEAQRKNIRIAAQAIAPLAAGHSIVVVHGNGPQVGLLSLQAEAYAGAEPYLGEVTPEDLVGYEFAAGSMGPRSRQPGACPGRALGILRS